MNRPKDDLDRTMEQVLKENPDMQEGLEKAEQAWDIAFQIRDLREKSGLTQKDLAKLVGTRQSNISRIEDADYTRYTLTTLEKVTKALKAKLEVRIIPEDQIRSVNL